MKCMLDEYGANGSGFAFTFEIGAVPRTGDHVHYAGREFRIVGVEWLPHEIDFPVRLLANEIHPIADRSPDIPIPALPHFDFSAALPGEAGEAGTGYRENAKPRVAMVFSSAELVALHELLDYCAPYVATAIQREAAPWRFDVASALAKLAEAVRLSRGEASKRES